MGLRLTNAADYAIRAMIHLACLPEGATALRRDIARMHRIPQSFMAKILRQLVTADLVRATRGPRGGCALAQPASETTLLDIVVAIEGPLGLTECSTNPASCEFGAECPAQPVWSAVQAKIAEILRGATLEDLVSAPRRRLRLAQALPPPAEAVRAKKAR